MSNVELAAVVARIEQWQAAEAEAARLVPEALTGDKAPGWLADLARDVFRHRARPVCLHLASMPIQPCFAEAGGELACVRCELDRQRSRTEAPTCDLCSERPAARAHAVLFGFFVVKVRLCEGCAP